MGHRQQRAFSPSGTPRGALVIACAVVLAGGLAGCNAFDPDLDDTPFRCGASEPVCPEGYVCSGEVCQRSGSQPDPVDGAAVVDASLVDSPPAIDCEDDEEENDTVATSTNTEVPDPSIDHRYVDLTICDDDVDLFRFAIAEAGQTIHVQVETGAGAPLSLAIVSSTGEVLVSGEVVGGDPTKLELTADMLPAGMDYFAKVTAAAGGQNSYDILLACSGTDCS
ncbi:MAG TPA: hypothetical protein VFG83_03965 [Kofleriaceae bacterium]|nr:hypothetical protein [Kofleriaceae bacterium]